MMKQPELGIRDSAIWQIVRFQFNLFFFHIFSNNKKVWYFFPEIRKINWSFPQFRERRVYVNPW